MSNVQRDDLPNGPFAAAIVAGGLGSATIGLLTVLAAASTHISDRLKFWSPAGSLTGKTTVGVLVFLASWLALHYGLRTKNVQLGRAVAIALTLLLLGLVGTFPPFFELFASE